MSDQIDFGPEEMVIIPLLSDMSEESDDVDIAMLEIDGKRTIPIYTQGTDTSGFILNEEVPLFWYEFNFRILVSMLDEAEDMILVNMGAEDEHVFALCDMQRSAPEGEGTEE